MIKLFFLWIGAFAAVAAGAQLGKPDSTQAVETIIQRVAVLLPSHSTPATPQVQWQIDRARASRGKIRAKAKRRSPASKAAVSTSTANTNPNRVENRTPAPEASAASRAPNGSGSVAAFSGLAALPVGKTDAVPPEQRVTLAQALLADTLKERLQDRLGLAVVSDSDTVQALQALHLTPEQAMQPDNARRLCAKLNCQAVLMPRVTACDIRESATRDAVVFADVRIAGPAAVEKEPFKTGAAGKTGAAANTSVKPAQVPPGNARQTAAPLNDFPVLTRLPIQIEIAGTARADRMLFHKQYQKPQGDVIRDATQQTVNLLLHTLRSGEQAPLLRPNDRIAVTPVLTPDGADKLIFTAAGRRVVPAPITDLHTEVSALFLPDLLPIAPDRVMPEDDVRAALTTQGVRESQLWTGEDQPALARVQAIGRSLRVDYVLLTRVTDVELSESAPNTGSAAKAGTSSANNFNANTSAAEQERSVRVEATAALVRVEDGALLWRDRATATMVASPPTAENARKPQTNQSLARDATHFALVELQRRLRRYRSTFER